MLNAAFGRLDLGVQANFGICAGTAAGDGVRTDQPAVVLLGILERTDACVGFMVHVSPWTASSS